MSMQPSSRNARRILTAAAILGATVLAGGVRSAAPPTPTSISQLPLTIAVPAHPQILFALGNSESMDGNLSGAIMAGSGSLGTSLSALQNSSSPLNFTIPSGFTPPVTPTAAGTAAYTVTVSGNLVDNSPSRLNVAKGGLTAVLAMFMSTADFALLDYSSSGVNLYTTWVYEMSPTTGGFVFTNTQGAGNRYVTNPCYNYLLVSATNPTLYANCGAISSSGKVSGSVSTSQYLQISATSDDPLINDVLYASGAAPVCMVYGGPSPPNPYPPNYFLSTYNNSPGSISESYSSQINSCATTTTPTNAGFVPFTPQTMYIQRGFGYGGGQSNTTGSTLVAMTSAGQTPTASTIATALAKFTPYLSPETNSSGTAEIKASAGQSALPGLLAGALTYYQTKNPASSNGCSALRYVVLVTDGLPTLDYSGKSWPPPGTASAVQYGMTVAFNGDSSLNTSGTNAQAVTDTITQLANLKTAGIKTYIIGLGAGVDPAQNPVAAQVLTAMAVAGGTGAYFAASSPAALTNDMQSIMTTILSTTQSTASTAVNSTGLHQGSLAYLAQFSTSDTFQDWTGDLSAYPISPSTGVVNTASSAALWSASTQLDSQSYDTGRLLATWDPVAKKATPFRWVPGLAPNGISATTNLGKALTTFAADTNGQDVLNDLRGNNAQEQRNGGQFRNRTDDLGDIVDSAPLYVGPPVGFSQAASYFSFAVTHKTRSPIIYVGANDGMLHAFDATTGRERFAYIPNGVFANLVNLVSPYYNQAHQFYVDGSPQAADVQFADSTWHTVLIGTERAGGSSVFALDITNADAITTEANLSSAVLWEFTDSNMGLSFSDPSFATTSAGWLVLFGNGYNSPTQKPFLYALDPQTGAVRGKVDLCAAVPSACNTALANGLSSVSVVNSNGQISAFANVVYAGDLQGNLWRVDITNSNPANWVVKVIFQARDSSSNPQPITTAPAVTLNPLFPQILGTMVMIGTGQFLGLADLSTTQVQTLYGIFDPPPGVSPPIGFAGLLTRSNLVKQTLVAATVGSVSVRTMPTLNTVTIPTNRGWYVDFSLAAGERLITDPQIEAGGGVVVTSYQPNVNSCAGGGNSWLTVLNFATGGSFPLPELDINGDGVINSGDVAAGANGGNPVSMSLGPVYASAATIVPSAGSASARKLMSVSTVQVKSVADRGGSKQRTSWWEMRH